MRYNIIYYIPPPKKIDFKRSICDRFLPNSKKTYKTYVYPAINYESPHKESLKSFKIFDFGVLETSIHRCKKSYCKTLIVVEELEKRLSDESLP